MSDPQTTSKRTPLLTYNRPSASPGEEGKVDILHAWPHLPIGDLDVTQWAALEQILTKKLSIVQGPPGTGKNIRFGRCPQNNVDEHEA